VHPLRCSIGGDGVEVCPATQENISGLEARLADLSRQADDRGPNTAAPRSTTAGWGAPGRPGAARAGDGRATPGVATVSPAGDSDTTRRWGSSCRRTRSITCSRV